MRYLLPIILISNYVLSVSHAEGQDMTEGLRSPVGRHQLEDYFHYIMFIIHDITSFFSCLFVIFQFYRNKDKLHPIFGYIFILFFLGSIITGFWLIWLRSNDDKLHINSRDINVITISTQGYCLIGITLHTFVLGKVTLNKNFIFFLKSFHYFNILMGFRSFKFLMGNIFREAVNHKDILNSENSIEMFLTVTLPQLTVEVIYLYIIRQLEKNDFKNFNWYKHHKMGIIYIVLIAVPGIIFNVVHDSYWLFDPPGITSPVVRIVAMLLPLWGFVWVQRDKLGWIIECQNKEKNY
jgi:hypothetical protein